MSPGSITLILHGFSSTTVTLSSRLGGKGWSLSAPGGSSFTWTQLTPPIQEIICTNKHIVIRKNGFDFASHQHGRQCGDNSWQLRAGEDGEKDWLEESPNEHWPGGHAGDYLPFSDKVRRYYHKVHLSQNDWGTWLARLDWEPRVLVQSNAISTQVSCLQKPAFPNLLCLRHSRTSIHEAKAFTTEPAEQTGTLLGGK